MADEHVVPVADGQAVAAVHHPAPSEGTTAPASDGTMAPASDGRTASDVVWIVFCHGFRSDKTGSYEHRCARAAEEGYAAVRFDFRGSGESDGAFADATLSTRVADLQAVLEYFDSGTCVLFGSSFGAKVALHADDQRVSAIVGRAPVTYNRAFEEYRSLVTEADGALRLDDGRIIDERFFEDFDRYPFADAVDVVDVPVALFHGTDDGSVPLSHTLEAAGELDTDVLVQSYAGEGHRFLAAAEAHMLDQLFDWLARVRIDGRRTQ